MSQPDERISPCMLEPEIARTKFEQLRFQPSPDVGVFVQNYWGAIWDLRGHAPYVHESLPESCMHLVFEQHWTRVVGVISGKFTTRLENDGQIFGICFKPGAFHALVKTPVFAFTDKTFPLSEVLGEPGTALETAILAVEDSAERVRIAEDFLRVRLPEPDEQDRLIRALIERIKTDRAIIKVDDLVSQMGINKRKLQRLFNQYVGVSPKAVIQRYRLNEAADHLQVQSAPDTTMMAVEYGYFDQSHFIKDFKTTVGRTPNRYARRVRVIS